jgi:hypothetical protein
MRLFSRIAIAGLAGLAACGGGSGGGGSPMPGVNAFTGSISVTSALPAGATCPPGATHTVTFNDGGVSTQQVTIPGGDCVTFTNSGMNPHRPATQAVNACPLLNAPSALSNGQSFTTQPLGAASGTQTCSWMDANNPPAGGGGY